MNHSFTLILEGPNPNDSENLNRLYDAGCDDATFGERDGVYVAEFDREAPSFSEALTSAIADVERAVPGLRVVRVEPEELVTASEIGDRTRRSRESIRQLFEGTRGPGEFPKPRAWLSDRTRLWQWSEVASWFTNRLNERLDMPPEIAKVVSLANVLLTMRSTPIAKALLPRITESASTWDEMLALLRHVEFESEEGHLERNEMAALVTTRLELAKQRLEEAHWKAWIERYFEEVGNAVGSSISKGARRRFADFEFWYDPIEAGIVDLFVATYLAMPFIHSCIRVRWEQVDPKTAAAAMLAQWRQIRETIPSVGT